MLCGDDKAERGKALRAIIDEVNKQPPPNKLREIQWDDWAWYGLMIMIPLWVGMKTYGIC